MIIRVLKVKGGEGSGNFGHAGRPGERGGSARGEQELPQNVQERIQSSPRKINARDLGLPVHEWTAPSGPTTERRITINPSEIALGRTDLRQERLLRASDAMREGFRTNQVTPVHVQRKPGGGYVVTADGNHRVAVLRLSGSKKPIEVVLTEPKTG
jgi:hypothetical protein